MANQIIERQDEAQAAKQGREAMQFIVAEEWDVVGECCAVPVASADDVDSLPAEAAEQDWGWGCCVA